MAISNEKYLPGNTELLTMFESKTFDREKAARILAEIPDLNQPILDSGSYSTTYLYEAETYNNVEAVHFLLENGADPNYCNLDILNSCALDDLHFLWEEMQEEAAQRLKIAKMFFEFGGDPNLLYDGETLYDHVLWEVFNDSYTPHDWEYIRSFFKILVAYGGGGGKSYNSRPKLSEPIDKSRIDEYEFALFQCEDGYHLEGHMINPDGVDIGIV